MVAVKKIWQLLLLSMQLTCVLRDFMPNCTMLIIASLHIANLLPCAFSIFILCVLPASSSQPSDTYLLLYIFCLILLLPLHSISLRWLPFRTQQPPKKWLQFPPNSQNALLKDILNAKFNLSSKILYHLIEVYVFIGHALLETLSSLLSDILSWLSFSISLINSASFCPLKLGKYL